MEWDGLALALSLLLCWCSSGARFQQPGWLSKELTSNNRLSTKACDWSS